LQNDIFYSIGQQELPQSSKKKYVSLVKLKVVDMMSGVTEISWFNGGVFRKIGR